MRFQLLPIVLLAAVMSGVNAAPAVTGETIEYGICSCFTPRYDASCCILAKGTMFDNVCDTPDADSSVDAYRACCVKSGGHDKCKTGHRDPKNPWPPEGSYGCNI
ncbi:hypothetical protein BGZ83_011376 [Gryganskiella cystojenkinii]|nr:hypothetical protein BGZ83_011376 [Gryganskiella cystojenkinii]